MVQLNTEDFRLISQPILDIRVKIDVYDERNNNHLDQLECGVINCTFTINAESDVRRVFSLQGTPVKNKRLTLNKDGLIWINRIIKVELGILNQRTNKWHWYKQGTFYIANTNATFDAVTNTINIDCSDPWINLDGSRRGQIGGAPTISYPAYIEDETTGEVIKYNNIRDIVITILTQLAGMKESDLQIDEMGEYKAMPEYNPDYLQYREESKVPTKNGLQELWCALPYDMNFSCGTSIASMLIELRDLYPNYEMYFDSEGHFVCKMIPSCYEDDIVLGSDFFDRIYISENTSVDLITVKNICEVWEQSIETDFYTETCTYTNNIYSATVDTYNKYCNGDIIAIQIPSANQESCSININNLGIIPIIDENTEEPIETNLMDANQVYVFKIKSKYINGSSVIQCYLLGQWQAHGLNVLTNGTISNEEYTTQDGDVVKVFSKEYFQDKYNCKSVEFTEITDSPFCVQELGEILDVKSGGDYENIESDSLALARAEYENWINCRLTDNITITTKLCPFADVNIKIAYRRKDINTVSQYIVKNVSHDPSAGTTSWTLMHFYPLYDSEDIDTSVGTWDALATYTWNELSNYSWNELSDLKGR